MSMWAHPFKSERPWPFRSRLDRTRTVHLELQVSARPRSLLISYILHSLPLVVAIGALVLGAVLKLSLTCTPTPVPKSLPPTKKCAINLLPSVPPSARKCHGPILSLESL